MLSTRREPKTADAMTDNLPENVGVNDEGCIRYRAARRGFRVMQTRGLECKRREETQATNGVALFAATLGDIAAFLKAHDSRQLH